MLTKHVAEFVTRLEALRLERVAIGLSDFNATLCVKFASFFVVEHA